MKLFLLFLSTGLLGVSSVSASPTPPNAEEPGHRRGDECRINPQSLTYCAGTNYSAALVSTYICGDWRLGPVQLPTKIPLDSVLELYDRLGGLCPGEFLDAFWNETLKPDPYWNFPTEHGFSLDSVTGKPIKGALVLEVGVLVDRFGGEGGTFVSPAAAPYMQRALPPSNLNTPKNDPTFPYNYHVYRVIKPLLVEAGPIAPWFRQPGQGVQYSLSQNISMLLNQQYLQHEDPGR
ncbi:hypothetical protein B0H66DRAFT_575033 [Apodospora peruviana]|uniref:TNT domain-containing protein n=1 Tax=Apodospora peruviana TaxID=516989 RepID=A0AAE0I3N1_9PEZI|nr:hypothetical protein B0H66DRAFT_575033 [Apodospora peruviana]